MRALIITPLILALAIAVPLAGLSQTQSKPDQQEETIRVGTAEVVLDAVVKDKKGRPIKDLTASDFEVYEDGVRQQIQSFRLVVREPGAPAAVAHKEERPTTGRTPLPSDSAAGIGAVALVFDRLSPESRNRAREAALNYIGTGLTQNDFVGIFGIDLSLHVLQPFTNNTQLVKQAIEGAGSQSPSLYASTAGQVRSLSDQQAGLQSSSSAAQGAVSGGGPGASAQAQEASATIGANAADQAFTEMTMRSLETFERLERNQQGYATTNGLLAIVNSLGRLPGRKSIIFFSEGLAIPPNVQAFFRAVISAANRANVSIYSLDAAGLRVESPNAEAAREIGSLGQRRIRQTASGADDTSGPMTRQLERNEDVLRLNPHSGLGQLAYETGGFLISETNDLSVKLRQVNEDLHTYYVMTYVPKNQNYDGRFRQIEVKLNRSNLDVQARKGYYAIKAMDASPVLPYEAPALAILNGGNYPGTFPVRVSGLNFPELNHYGLVPIMVEAPLSAFTYSSNNEKKTYMTDFSIVVLIKDEAQQVVRKLSKQYLLSGPLDKMEADKRGEVLFYQEAELAPGRYTIEAVAYDAPSGKASVRTGSIEVPNADETKLRLSSVVVIKRAERLSAADQKTANPFHFGELLVYPNLGEPLRKQASKQLPFYFTVYPRKGATATPKLTIEVLQNGRTLGKAPSDLPAVDATGRIQYVGALPLESLQPGGYELKITVIDGETSVSRAAHFTVEP